MFCTNCGAQNPDTAAFCEQCGSPLTKPAEPVQPVAPPAQKMFDTSDNFENVDKLPDNAQLIDMSRPVEPVPPVQPTMSAASPVDLQKPGQEIPVQPVPSAQAAQPVYQQPQQFQQPVGGMQPGQPAQPVYQQPQQFQQPVGGMQQPGGMQPAYAAPVYTQAGTQKKSKAVPIIVISSISAVIVAFLIVLFTVIIPNSGIKGKLRHKWSVTDGGVTLTYDFKKNTVSTMGFDVPINWSIQGDDHLTIEMSMFGIVSETSEYIFSISDDGKTLTLRDADYPSSSMVLQRVG